MAKRLTDRTVDAAKPNPDKRIEIADELIPAFRLVIQPSGRKSWAVRYLYKRKQKKLTLGSYPTLNLADARYAARDALMEVSKGTDPAETKRRAKLEVADDNRDMIRVVFEDFFTRHVSKNKSAKETRRIWEKEMLPKWGDMKIQDITKRDVIELLDGIVDRGSPIMANRAMASIRKLFNWAVSRDVLQFSPVQGVTPPGTEHSRKRFLNDDEIRWLWKAAEELRAPFGQFYQMLLLTGQRLSEVAAMTDSELNNGIWTIPASRTKNGNEQAIPLSGSAVDVLASVPRISGSEGYYFTTTGRTPISGFTSMKKRMVEQMHVVARRDQPDIVIPHWTPHDLRRTVASGMGRLGISLQVAEKCLNHISGSLGGIAGVYNRYDYADEMEAAFEVWARFVKDTLDGQGADNVVELR